MKKIICAILLCTLVLGGISAGSFISANDLKPAKLTARTEFEDDIAILATNEKGVTIENLSESRTAPDEEVFNARIKLGGSGNSSYRAIAFEAEKGDRLTIYLNSSSKTDARNLVLARADGTPVTTFIAPADDGKAGMVSTRIASDGDYLVYSAASGINIYALICED